MVVRSGHGVAPVGYMSGRDPARALGSQQGITFMTLSVRYINEFSVLSQLLDVRFCGDVVCMMFVLCADHEL